MVLRTLTSVKLKKSPTPPRIFRASVAWFSILSPQEKQKPSFLQNWIDGTKKKEKETAFSHEQRESTVCVSPASLRESILRAAERESGLLLTESAKRKPQICLSTMQINVIFKDQMGRRKQKLHAVQFYLNNHLRRIFIQSRRFL